MSGSTISDGLVIEGELQSDEPLSITGTVRGAIGSTSEVRVEEGGKVVASVEAHTVRVAGELRGNVIASDRVDLEPGAKLMGDVRALRLTIADGASFKGKVDMEA